MKNKISVVACAIFFILLYSIALLPHEKIDELTNEDGFVENLSALFFFSASILFFFSYLKSTTGNNLLYVKTKKNIFFLLFFFLFLFIAGEEVSWGQRFFELETADFFKEKNLQSENNLHNLKIFNSVDENNTERSWYYIFTMSRLFRIFWFTLCLVLPIACALNNQVHRLCTTVNFPIFPLYFGHFLLLSYLLNKYLEKQLGMHLDIVEVEECYTAIIFFFISLKLVPESSKKLNQYSRSGNEFA